MNKNLQNHINYILNGQNILGINFQDINELLNQDGETIVLKLYNKDIELENELNQSIKNEILKAKSIIVIFEQVGDKPLEKYLSFMEYIYSFINGDVSAKYDIKLVNNVSSEPISILLGGYINDDEYLLQCGQNFTDFWVDNSRFCKEKFQEIRDKTYNLKPIKIESNEYYLHNEVKLFDAQNYILLNEFEFSTQSIDDFNQFTAHLQIILEAYQGNKNAE